MHGKHEMNNNLMVCNSHSHITKFNNDYDQYHHSYVVSISKCRIQYLKIMYLDYQHQHDHFRQLQPFVLAIFFVIYT
jgi:hypothetical protein